MNELENVNKTVFEGVKHIDDNGNEYWYARELQKILGYNQWRSINELIERAKVACIESKNNVDDHFAVQRKMINLAKGAIQEVKSAGLLGAFTGGVKASAGGIATAIFFGYIASLIAKPKIKKQ